MITAVKSLIISRWLKPRFFFISAIENAQVWLVIATQSPVIGQAMAIQPRIHLDLMFFKINANDRFELG